MAVYDKSPSEVIQLWNTALFEGHIDVAQRYTSKTSSEHIRRTVGSLENLSKRYQSAKGNRGRNVIERSNIDGNVARVVYTVYYADGAIKRWEDTLLREEGLWKVAPQFAQVRRLR